VAILDSGSSYECCRHDGDNLLNIDYGFHPSRGKKAHLPWRIAGTPSISIKVSHGLITPCKSHTEKVDIQTAPMMNVVDERSFSSHGRRVCPGPFLDLGRTHMNMLTSRRTTMLRNQKQRKCLQASSTQTSFVLAKMTTQPCSAHVI
jgi:hypothetical protein